MMQCSVADISKVSLVLDNAAVHYSMCGSFCSVPGALADKALTSGGTIVLMPNDGTVLVFSAYNRSLYQVHLAVHPGFRGRMAIAACKGAFDWMFQNTDCRKIVGFCDERKKAHAWFFGIIGGVREGLLANFDGSGNGMIVFGVSKP